MIDYEEALRLVLDAATPRHPESVSVESCLGRVLAEEVRSREDLPLADNSAMDGYALRSADTRGATRESPVRLRVVGEVPAGRALEFGIDQGQAARIMTGAPIPQGATAVVPIEEVESREGEVLLAREAVEGENIRRQGEDLRAGATALAAGTRLRPAEVALLAAIGGTRVRVHRSPVVSVIATGSELLEVGGSAQPGMIRDSNSPLVAALCKEIGVPCVVYGQVRDEPGLLEAEIRSALASSDVLITTGGVSVGDYDLVKDVLAALGARRIFWQVAQKPGKPLAFYSLGDKAIFGLPGNPGSVLVTFLEYVRPFLLKCLGGSRVMLPEVQAVFRGTLHAKGDRLVFLHVRAWREKDGTIAAEPAGEQGSGILSTCSRANAIAIVPRGTRAVSSGDRLRVQLTDGMLP